MHVWHTERLWELAQALPRFELPLDSVRELDMDCWFLEDPPTLRAVAEHARRIQDADPDFPVILAADGSLMDGGHRICRAWIEARPSVPAVRFPETPPPDEILDPLEGTESGVFDLEESIDILERTPQVLRAWLLGLSETWTRNTEGPGTWSPFDVVGHLIDGERTDWMVRTRVILSDSETRRFEPFDRFGHLEANRDRTLDSLLEEFAGLRAGNLKDLRALNLDAVALARTGEHPEFGTVTLSQLLSTWTVHDLGHVAQIARAMAGRYAHAVGPWREYLPVVQGLRPVPRESSE